jgi:hypothetical protein
MPFMLLAKNRVETCDSLSYSLWASANVPTVAQMSIIGMAEGTPV